MTSYSLFDTIRSHSDSEGLQSLQTDCANYFKEILSSEDYKKTKLYTLNIAMDSIKKTGDFHVSKVAKIITTVLSPEDLEQDYYKMMIIMNLVSFQDAVSDFERISSPETENSDKPLINDRNLVHIHVTNVSDSVSFNERMVAISDLSELTKGYILSDKSNPLKPELELVEIENIGACYQSKLIISLLNDKDAKYATYVNVQNQLFKAYELARDDMSKKYFNKQLNELTDVERKAIDELIPLRITDAEQE